jgi:hypothetical protein
MWNLKPEQKDPRHDEPTAQAQSPAAGTNSPSMVQKLCEEYEAQIAKLEAIIVEQRRQLDSIHAISSTRHTDEDP